MNGLKVWKLENMALKSDNGTVRSRRCNTIDFYCPACDMWHTQKREDSYIIQTGDETTMLCKEAYACWRR